MTAGQSVTVTINVTNAAPVAHDGEVAFQRVKHLTELAGMDVILVHRMLKNDVPVSFEPGGAVPGDRVVGVLMPGEGIRIFQIHAPSLKEY